MGGCHTDTAVPRKATLGPKGLCSIYTDLATFPGHRAPTRRTETVRNELVSWPVGDQRVIHVDDVVQTRTIMQTVHEQHSRLYLPYNWAAGLAGFAGLAGCLAKPQTPTAEGKRHTRSNSGLWTLNSRLVGCLSNEDFPSQTCQSTRSPNGRRQVADADIYFLIWISAAPGTVYLSVHRAQFSVWDRDGANSCTSQRFLWKLPRLWTGLRSFET